MLLNNRFLALAHPLVPLYFAVALIEHRGPELLALPRPADFAACHHLLRTVPCDLPMDALSRRTVALLEAGDTSPPSLYTAAGVLECARQAAWASFPYPWFEGARTESPPRSSTSRMRVGRCASTENSGKCFVHVIVHAWPSYSSIAKHAIGDWAPPSGK